jgi:hypothetical protein
LAGFFRKSLWIFGRLLKKPMDFWQAFKKAYIKNPYFL